MSIKQIEKGRMILNLRKQDVENLKTGNIIVYDREWLPFKIDVRYLDVE